MANSVLHAVDCAVFLTYDHHRNLIQSSEKATGRTVAMKKIRLENEDEGTK